MRSVCGCMPASSAATEIMYTPRAGSEGSRPPRARGPSGWPPSPLATSRPPRQELLARVAVHHRGQVVHRLALLARERARHVDRQPVVDVAAAAAVQLRRALAPPAPGACPLRAPLPASRTRLPSRTPAGMFTR